MDMRQSIGDAVGLAPFHILMGPVVKELCRRRPVDLATLKSVDGMSDTKVADFGAEIIKVRVEWGRTSHFVRLDHRSRISACNHLGALLDSNETMRYRYHGTFLLQSWRRDDAVGIKARRGVVSS